MKKLIFIYFLVFSILGFSQKTRVLDQETGKMIKGDIKKATAQCMKNIGVLLKKHDMDFEDLVMVNIYMTDMDNYGAINEEYKKFFKNNKSFRVNKFTVLQGNV